MRRALRLGVALVALGAVLAFITYDAPCTCDTDSDCMLRCGGDGSPEIEP